MTDIDTKEPLSNISDSSFVILGQSSQPSSISNETADVEFSNKNQNTFVVFEPNKFFSYRNTPSRSCDSQSFLEDDIQEKLKQLVRENNQLKETLSQNNLAIKSQLDTFYMWQQEVLRTHETHKEKFLETKDLILKLRAENLNLKKQLTEGFCTIDNDEDFQRSKKFDSDNLKQETDKWKSVSEDLRSKNEILEIENTKLKEKLKFTEKEVFKLNSELEDVMRENKFLKQKSYELSKNSANGLSHGSLPNAEVQTQISNLFKQLEMERNKTSNLKEKLRKVNNMISKTQNLSVTQEVDECLKNLDDLNLSCDCQNERFSTLQSWVTLAEENLDNANQNLLGEIKELKCHISQEEKTCKEKQENIQELKDQFNRLLDDYKALQQQLILIQSKNADTEKGENEKIINLPQLLEGKENELLIKQEECDQLKEDEELNLECKEIASLKIQVQLYKNYFNDERTAREKLVGEKEAMAEQIRFLQSKLKALQKGPAEKQDEKKAEKLKSFLGPQEVRKGVFLCPKCMYSFSDFQICSEHIDNCINADFYF